MTYPKRALLLLAALTLPACAQEVLSVHDSSIASQFSQLNGNGWAVNRNDQTAKNSANANDPKVVRVIHEANWTGMRFNTNFQVDDPEVRAQLERQHQQGQSTPNQVGNPTGAGFFGPAPK